MSGAGRRRGLAPAALAALAFALPALACAPREPERRAAAPGFRPTRHDYAAFRAGFPDIPEPNYLPFVVQRVPARDVRGDALVFCRWSASQMPIRVSVEPPAIPATLQDEFHPVAPEAFVAAVDAALSTYERTLEGAVRFARVARADDAVLRVRLLGELAPAPADDVAVLGATALGGACRAGAIARDGRRVDVRFEARQVRLYVADDYGLLTPEQVERVALHELGHVLGVRGHSPIPADLMYEVAHDRVPQAALSDEDANTLRALYWIPNGTVYGWIEPGASEIAQPRPAPALARGPPVLEAEPRTDHHGLSFRPPRGWQLGETPYGVYVVDGTPWDYDASLQLVIQPSDSVDAYLARRIAEHVGAGWLRERKAIEAAHRSGVRLEIEGRIAGIRERVDVIALGNGRVLVAIADASEELYSTYTAVFDAVLETVELSPTPQRP